MILATKFGLLIDDEGRLAGGSRAYVFLAVEASLKRLKTEWIDIYYLHRPDPATPIEETLGVLDELVRQGKVRFAGCSNLPGPQLADAMEVARTKKRAPFVAARTNTTCCLGRSKRASCRSSNGWGSRSSPISRWRADC